MLSRKLPRVLVLRVFFVVALVILCSLFQNAFLSRYNSVDYYGFFHSLYGAKSSASNILTERAPLPNLYDISHSEDQSLLGQKISNLWASYFHWIIPHWIFLFPFLLSFFVVAYRRNALLLSFYIASFSFYLVATLANSFGYRSAIVLWPLTYIIFAFSSRHFLEILQTFKPSRLRSSIHSFSSVFIFLFLLLNASSAILMNSHLNTRDDFPVSAGLKEFVEEMDPKASLSLPAQINNSPFGIELSEKGRLLSVFREPDYVILLDPESVQERSSDNSFGRFMENLVQSFGFHVSSRDTLPSRNFSGKYTLVKNVDSFSIYQK
jgi:hypothetical protein